jgi:hypothetical protein
VTWAWLPSAPAAGDVDSGFFAAQHDARGFGLDALAAGGGFGQGALGLTAGFLGAGLIELVGAFRGVGQDQDLIAGDLQKSAADGHGLF